MSKKRVLQMVGAATAKLQPETRICAADITATFKCTTATTIVTSRQLLLLLQTRIWQAAHTVDNKRLSGNSYQATSTVNRISQNPAMPNYRKTSIRTVKQKTHRTINADTYEDSDTWWLKHQTEWVDSHRHLLVLESTHLVDNWLYQFCSSPTSNHTIHTQAVLCHCLWLQNTQCHSC